MSRRGAVLVVDDEALVRLSLAEGLRAEGFICVAVDGAAPCRNILTQMKFDALVADALLGGRADGLALIEWAASSCPDMKLVAISGAPIDIGGRGAFLQKPFRHHELLTLLDTLLAGSAEGSVVSHACALET